MIYRALVGWRSGTRSGTPETAQIEAVSADDAERIARGIIEEKLAALAGTDDWDEIESLRVEQIA